MRGFLKKTMGDAEEKNPRITEKSGGKKEKVIGRFDNFYLLPINFYLAKE